MRYIIIILSFFVAYNAHSQVTDTQLRVRPDQDPDSILVMSNDTNSSLPTYRTGKWRKLSGLIGSVAGDSDWWKLGGTTIPTNSDSAYRSGYTLFNGLSGGLPTKIEILKEGLIRFDWPEEGDGSVHNYLKSKPVQQSQGNTDWNEGVFTASGAGDRWNNIHYQGWNLLGGGREDASSTAVGLFIEDHYDLNTDNIKSEIIFTFIDSSGTAWRPFWMNIDKKYREDWTAIFTNVTTSFTSSINQQPYIQLSTSSDTVSSILRMTSPKSNDTKGVELEWNQTTNQLGLTPFGTSNSTFNITMPYTSTVALRRTSDTRVDNGLTMTDLAATSSGGYFGTALIDGTLDFSYSTLSVDTSLIATQYDLTLVSGGATDLTIGGSGPTYTIESSTGTDVTIAAGGINALSESPANTLVITATEVDGSTTNEIQDLSITGASSPFTLDISGSSNDVSFSQLFGIILGESPANTLTIKADTTVLATPYDISGFGTMSNWLLAASGTGGTETITHGETVTISETTGLDVTRSTNTVAVALSIDEFSADGTPEGDELLLAYDASGTNHELIDINDLPYLTAEVDGSTTNEIQTLDATGTTTVTWDLSGDASDISLTGAGISSVSRSGNAVTVTSTEVDGSTTNEAWTIDADDPDTELITNQTVIFEGIGGIATNYIPLTNTLEIDGSGIGGTDTNFAEDDLTFTGNRSHDMGSNSLTLHGTAANVYIQDDNGGTGNTLVLVSELGTGTGITGGISFQSENSGTPTEQYDIEAQKVSSTQSILRISGEQATDAEIIFEKNADLNNNATESHLAINAGVAFTQNYDVSTSGDLDLDRSYYTINITGGSLTDTIKLPEVINAGDNWYSSLTTTQVQVGQEYVISNLRSGTNLIISAYNPSITNGDDLIGTRTQPGGSAGSAISLSPGKTVIIKCYQFTSNIGYWNYWISSNP